MKKHSSDAFFGCDEPLEAATFSALLEIVKARYRDRDLNRDWSPGPDQEWERKRGREQELEQGPVTGEPESGLGGSSCVDP